MSETLENMKERLSKVNKLKKKKGLDGLSTEELKELLEKQKANQKARNDKRQAKINLLRLIDKEEGMFNKMLMLMNIYAPEYDQSEISDKLYELVKDL